VRRWFREQPAELFRELDALIIAPITFTSAPVVGQTVVKVGGEETSIRANLDICTQPLSFIGLPANSAPVAVSGLPIGVQLIACLREDLIFRLAARLERLGFLAVKPPRRRRSKRRAVQKTNLVTHQRIFIDHFGNQRFQLLGQQAW
jgi:Asp-tRNA(Asn)/Glu-tRNA(Gln) amidotransferase A subunit family amidase